MILQVSLLGINSLFQMGSENDQQQGTDFKEASQGRNTGPANPASQELTPEQLKVD